MRFRQRLRWRQFDGSNIEAPLQVWAQKKPSYAATARAHSQYRPRRNNGGGTFVLPSVHVPGMDGHEATRQTREMEEREAPDHLANRADCTSENIDACFTAEMDDCLASEDLARGVNGTSYESIGELTMTMVNSRAPTQGQTPCARLKGRRSPARAFRRYQGRVR